MSGSSWIAERLNEKFSDIKATPVGEDIILLERDGKSDAYIGVVATPRGDTSPTINEEQVAAVFEKQPNAVMMVAIPKDTRWSGAAMCTLQGKNVSFGGFGDLMSAIGREDMSQHRNKTFEFVNDGLLKHSNVSSLNWLDSKRVEVRRNSGNPVVIALCGEYDITMDVARSASRCLGDFDVLLKTNPNGSITSAGRENVTQLGFSTLKWGELFGYLAKANGTTQTGPAGISDLKRRLQHARKLR